MSVLRSVLTYMGLGPDEEYDDRYLYEADRRRRAERPEPAVSADEPEIDLREHADPHAQRARPEWMVSPDDVGEHSGSGGESFDEPADADEPTSQPAPRQRGRHDADPPPEKHLRPLRAVPASSPAPVEQPAPDPAPEVVSVPELVKPSVLVPRAFSDAKLIADDFKASRPLVMDLREVDRALARRLIDFASGICYALDGGMEKLATQVFLLTPSNVDVSEADRGRLAARDYRDGSP